MPRITQVIAVKSSEGNSKPWAAWIIMSPKMTPIPVRDTMPTTNPAQAQPITMDMELKADFAMAGKMLFRVNRFFLSKSMITGTAQVAHRAEYSGEYWATNRQYSRIAIISR